MKHSLFLFSIIFIASAISLQSSSCGSKHKRAENDSVMPKGKIIPVVVCRKDFNQSYALYLPSDYSENKKWAIVYAFDSHGKGLLPVVLFKDEAEKYGYIIVGSNNSKNGTPRETTLEIWDTLYSDTHHRFSIDDKRIYAAGFSGGSRVAGTIAITRGGINTVIGCGAGLGSQEKPVQKFSYFGIAGNVDMNMNEMVNLDSMFEKSGYRHYLEIFLGKHEWSPKPVVADAFLWLELNAMRDKLISPNDTLISRTLSKWKGDYKTIINNENDLYKAYLLCLKVISFFDGLTDVSFFKNELSALKTNPVVMKAIKHLEYISKEEETEQSYYGSAIATENIAWWTTQVAQMNSKMKTTSDSDMKFMYKRVLNYLSLSTYMYVNKYLKAGQYEQVLKYNSIYALVDPENPEHAYISATLSMKNNNLPEAITYLEKAAKSGFAEPDRLENDTVMTRLKQLEKYTAIMQSIQNNVKEQK